MVGGGAHKYSVQQSSRSCYKSSDINTTLSCADQRLYVVSDMIFKRNAGIWLKVLSS